MSATPIETHSVFVFTLSLPPFLFHPHSDEQPVKVKRKKSFNLSRKFPFYKSKENIVQELVESEREYQPCGPVWGRGARGGFILSFPRLRSFFQLPYFGSPPRVVGASAQLLSPSHLPREKPHTLSRHEAQNVVVGGTLWCVSEHLSLGFRGVSGCVRVLSAALTHTLSKHCEACLRVSHDQFFSPSLTHNEKNLIN